MKKQLKFVELQYGLCGPKIITIRPADLFNSIQFLPNPENVKAKKKDDGSVDRMSF
jgi:hypothetical protein